MLLACGAVAATAGLVTYVLSEGPDQSQVGVVTRAEPHRVCVATDDGEFCAHVDTPAAVVDIDVGDCIEMRRSSDQILESADSSDRC